MSWLSSFTAKASVLKGLYTSKPQYTQLLNGPPGSLLRLSCEDDIAGDLGAFSIDAIESRHGYVQVWQARL